MSAAGLSSGEGFFENEMGGYRLAKAAKLSAAERRHAMTLTKNSTHFADEGQEDGGRSGRTWFAEGVESSEDGAEWEEDGATAWWCDDDGAWWDEETYWTEWPSSRSSPWDED